MISYYWSFIKLARVTQLTDKLELLYNDDGDRDGGGDDDDDDDDDDDNDDDDDDDDEWGWQVTFLVMGTISWPDRCLKTH